MDPATKRSERPDFLGNVTGLFVGTMYLAIAVVFGTCAQQIAHRELVSAGARADASAGGVPILAQSPGVFWVVVLLSGALIARLLFAAVSYIRVHADLFGPCRPMPDRRRFDLRFACAGFLVSVGTICYVAKVLDWPDDLVFDSSMLLVGFGLVWTFYLLGAMVRLFTVPPSAVA